jgi:hypothetical protein
MYQYGTTTAENVIPATFEPVIPLPYTELILSGFPSGTVIALRYAVQLSSLTGKRGKTPTVTPVSSTQKIIATPSSVAM